MHGSPCRSPGFARSIRGALLVAGREGAGGLAVLHVGGDGQDGLGRDRSAVHRQALDLAHDGGDNPLGDLVGAIIIVAVQRELTLGAVADDQIVIGASTYSSSWPGVVLASLL